MTSVLAPTIAHRFDFVYLFDVTDGNPNGDPDAGNSPRIDPETGHGLVSDVCLKRKIRNFITLSKAGPDGTPEPGYDIYVKERAILNRQHQLAYKAKGLTLEAKKDEDRGRTIDVAREWMCQTFFDIRMFGAVMSTEVNCGQVRGPVQFTFARSVDPIVALEQAITRMAVTTEREAQAQAKEAGNRTMGRKELVPYGLYRAHGFISPHLAAQTGFSPADLDLLWRALLNMFDHDRSAARGEMTARGLIVFEHSSTLGNAPARKLFDRVTVRRRGETGPPRRFEDYEVIVNQNALPGGVTVRVLE